MRRVQEEQDDGGHQQPRNIPSNVASHTLSEKFESLDYEIVENELVERVDSNSQLATFQ
jgi:hypothetical protein